MNLAQASTVPLLLLLASPAARAAETQCIQCCKDAGLYSCPTELRVYGEGSQLRSEGGGWRVTGLWVLDCETGARFEPALSAVVQLEPRKGELMLGGSPRVTAECFRDWCQLPANGCIQERAGGSLTLLRCTDGQPMRAQEILKPGLPPPSVYISPNSSAVPRPNPGSVPPATAPSASSGGANASAPYSTTVVPPAEPTTVFVTRTVTLRGGKRIVTETTTRSDGSVIEVEIPEATTAPQPAATATAQPTTGQPGTRVVQVEPPQPRVVEPPVIEPPVIEPSAAPAQPRGGIIVQQAVLAEAASQEYPPHLPAEGPLDIRLAFSLPEVPGERCVTSSAVAREATRRLDKGDEARLGGDFQTAVEEYRAAVTLDRCNAIAWAAMGQLALQSDDLAKAVPSLEVATRLRPDHYGALTNLGLAYEALGRDLDAAQAFEAALQARPGHPPAAEGLRRVRGAP